jgi:hypothetical protein
MGGQPVNCDTLSETTAMKFITTKQARVRISQLRARLAKELTRPRKMHFPPKFAA